jgi:hypothetical protein
MKNEILEIFANEKMYGVHIEVCAPERLTSETREAINTETEAFRRGMTLQMIEEELDEIQPTENETPLEMATLILERYANHDEYNTLSVSFFEI